MKQYATIIGVVIVIGVAAWVVSAQIAKAPTIIACSTDALLCPDGSAVGRTGPNCEFAPCPVGPVATTTPPNTSHTLAIGEKSIINGTTIRVLELVEDSRCPVDVQCIQAGTVRVRASVDLYTTDFIFGLNVPQVVGKVTITLIGVSPAERERVRALAVKPADYRFTFSVSPTVTPPPVTSGVSGRVVLGPTCPVQSVEPNPACDPQPYQTSISVYKKGSTSLYTTGTSDATGAFKIALPPGSYTLAASENTKLPRCSPVDMTVVAAAYATTTIFCDTGIR